jgi:signal peptidase I
MQDKVLHRNGQAVDEEYVIHRDPQIRPAEYDVRDNFGPTTVPDGTLFMLGDNRDYSHDSRYWGPVDFDLVKGRAMFIYWSWDREQNWPRFNRLFKAIR